MSYDSSREYPAMSKCPEFNGCSAPLCPMDPNLEYTEVRDGRVCGRHWWSEYDEVCQSRAYWKTPMVKAQRKIVKRPKLWHQDHEFSVAELIEIGNRKHPGNTANLIPFPKRSVISHAEVDQFSTQIA
jgi:hypothetical protein